jgi:ketosteroid isomerase-like protein
LTRADHRAEAGGHPDSEEVGRVDVIADPFEDAQRELRARVAELFAAVDAGERDSLPAFHINSPKFTKFDDVPPLDRQDYSTAMAAEAAEVAALDSIRSDLRDLRVDVFGPVALVTGVYAYQAVVGGEPVDGASRMTLVFVHDDGAWRIAHEHWSALPTGG